jgi:hypothetical protein
MDTRKYRSHDGTIGDRDLSAWLVCPGICWVQSRSSLYARKLAQRSDSRLVARGVAGGFLRTFEFHHGLAWAELLLARYIPVGEATKEAFLRPAATPRGRSEHNDSHSHLPPQRPLQGKTHP